MPTDEPFLMFPPPKRSTEKPILALIVEKKGDERRTSMKQDEMYCFSPWIRIRDGCMIIPKIHWNNYQPGDWIVCSPEYAIDKTGNVADEKELKNLQKVDRSDYKMCSIPPTHVYNGNVRIQCQFTLCPKFIKNRETQNGRHKKLYILNIGQGFVSCGNPAFKQLGQRSYFGVFEFRGKDYGAVNFTRRYEKDYIEDRDAMWELIRVLDKRVSREDVAKMKDTLVKLKNEAEANHREWRNQRAEAMNMKTPTTTAVMEKPPPKVDIPSTSISPPEVIDDSDNVNAFIDQIIVQGMFPDKDGNMQKMWKDLETGETTTNDDLLRFKLLSRYGIPDNVATTTPTQIVEDTRSSAHMTPSTSVAPRNRSVVTNIPAPEDLTPRVTDRNEYPGETTFFEIIRRDNNANPVLRSQSTNVRV
ncbi:hypothetical protein CAEBREN_08522 [Caenorhabditis brenneri]|uniref:Uncharacterized protein n=1 Tax=Caenorhabditis brenneri TaxID=135651 RepID=G0NBF2_CAEBE|nr:hypothetical protein CAEBREN_08522 [Caenorhabditis brenneri]